MTQWLYYLSGVHSLLLQKVFLNYKLHFFVVRKRVYKEYIQRICNNKTIKMPEAGMCNLEIGMFY